MTRAFGFALALAAGCSASTEVMPGGSGATSEVTTGDSDVTGSATRPGSTSGTGSTTGSVTDATSTAASGSDSTSNSTSDATVTTDTGSSSGSDTGSTSALSSGSSGSTSGTGGTPALVVAGELLVDLSAEDPSAGTATWDNTGTASDFARVSDPSVVNIGGATGVEFDGDDAYVGQANAPTSITGLDPTRSIEVWIYNASLGGEETAVGFGRRGGPLGTNMSFGYGNDPNFGAVSHWTPDYGWSTPPAAGAWHHLVYTYDGATLRIYADGVLDLSDTPGGGAVDTTQVFPIVIGAQNNPDTTLALFLTGVVARVRVHSEVLLGTDVTSNFELERAVFGI